MKVKVICRKFECRKDIHYKTQKPAESGSPPPITEIIIEMFLASSTLDCATPLPQLLLGSYACVLTNVSKHTFIHKKGWNGHDSKTVDPNYLTLYQHLRNAARKSSILS